VTTKGENVLKIVTLHCPRHTDLVYRPEENLTPPRTKYGFDLIAEIGCLRFLEHKQISEIRELLSGRGILLPLRSIQMLSDRFLEYVVAAHLESLPLLAKLLKDNGGYMLHIDGTGTRGPMIFLAKDGWSGIRLLATPIPGESVEAVVPHLAVLRKNLGAPVAALRDMSEGLDVSIKKTFPGTYVITCHYHFLREVGLKLFEPLYPRFRNSVDRTGVKKRLKALRKRLRSEADRSDEEQLALQLVEHVLDFKRGAKGVSYPLALPAVTFYRRCEEAQAEARTAILSGAEKNRGSPALSRLENVLRLLKPPPIVRGRLLSDFIALEERWQWFERVRRALRYRNGPIPLSTQSRLSDEDLEKGRRKLDWLVGKIEARLDRPCADHQERELHRRLEKVARFIEKRRDELFAPNVQIKVRGKGTVRHVSRTNATVEADFRCLRRHNRRINGNLDVEPQVQRTGAGMLIAMNLANKMYVRVVYGSIETMANTFSSVKPESLRAAKKLIAGSK
jgi:hypothetical protein